MRIAETRHGAVTVLRPEGPLTEEAAGPLREAFASCSVRALGRVVLDCAASPHADSDGLEALVDIAERMTNSGMSLKLVGPTETLRETLDLTELAPMFEYYADVNSAVRSFL